jgi:Heavy metal associated domain 2
MIPEAHVSHELTRRLRIRVPSKKGNASYFSSLVEQLSECPGIEEIRVIPRLGTALILHEIESGIIVAFAKKMICLMSSGPRQAAELCLKT